MERVCNSRNIITSTKLSSKFSKLHIRFLMENLIPKFHKHICSYSNSSLGAVGQRHVLGPTVYPPLIHSGALGQSLSFSLICSLGCEEQHIAHIKEAATYCTAGKTGSNAGSIALITTPIVFSPSLFYEILYWNVGLLLSLPCLELSAQYRWPVLW